MWFNPWIGKSPWRRAGQPTPVSCLENPMDRGTWWTTVHRVAQIWTRLKQFSMHAKQGEICYSHVGFVFGRHVRVIPLERYEAKQIPFT